MKNTTKLWLSLGLLIPAEFVACVEAQGSNNPQAIVTETKQEITVKESTVEENLEITKETIDKSEQYLNKEITQLFANFFNEDDTMSFSKFVHTVITLLKMKQSSLNKDEQIKCDEVIKTLESNKHNYNFAVWAKILISPSLLDLIPEESRTYIYSVPNKVKIKALIQKLRNNNHH